MSYNPYLHKNNIDVVEYFKNQLIRPQMGFRYEELSESNAEHLRCICLQLFGETSIPGIASISNEPYIHSAC